MAGADAEGQPVADGGLFGQGLGGEGEGMAGVGGDDGGAEADPVDRPADEGEGGQGVRAEKLGGSGAGEAGRGGLAC